MSDKNKLLLRKLFVSFIVGFGGSFIPFITGWAQAPNYSFDKSVWIAALMGAVAAGVRALLAFGPINLVPSDKQHSLVAVKPDTPTPPAA